jgi:RNase adapter protein RapZ
MSLETELSKLVIITGLSGAGKTLALRFFEDQGHYCIDNLPATLVPKLAELVAESESPKKHTAVCVDARSGNDLTQLPAYVDDVRKLGFKAQILFLEASNEVLHRRYSESRRRHPAAEKGGIEEGIHREWELLTPIREQADLVLDTSTMSSSQLRERIAAMVSTPSGSHKMVVEVVSFGFKYGNPKEANLLLDVRFLPNPYYDEDLRPLTGNDADVREFVLNNDKARDFFQHAKGMLKYLMPQYDAEPKAYLTIAIGCTGGRHRSVAMAQEVLWLLRDMDYDVRIRHRDIDRHQHPA